MKRKTVVRQHLRKSKKGLRIIHRHPRFIRARSQIYLDPLKKGIFVDSTKPGKIFIGKSQHPKHLIEEHMPKSIQHEELHSVIGDEMGQRTSSALDTITIPRLFDEETGELINPKTHGEIVVDLRKAAKMVEEEAKERGYEPYPNVFEYHLGM